MSVVQVWFKTTWHLPFCFKIDFTKIPQTIEKSEQFRCHLNCSLLLVAGLGFEPRQTESESVVLPLHNPASTENIIPPQFEFVKRKFAFLANSFVKLLLIYIHYS